MYLVFVDCAAACLGQYTLEKSFFNLSEVFFPVKVIIIIKNNGLKINFLS